jgi:hypothetical protein
MLGSPTHVLAHQHFRENAEMMVKPSHNPAVPQTASPHSSAKPQSVAAAPADQSHESQPDVRCSISDMGRQLNDVAARGAAGATVDNHGRQLLVARLYDGREPAVYDGTTMSPESSALSSYLYLNQQDRQLVSDVYSYAESQGMDLAHVDMIAADLGGYRQRNDGRLMSNFNDGNSYDSQGWQVTVDFNEHDAAIASRVVNGAAINTTRFDQGFLRYVLDPGFGALGHAGDFSFLEHIVSRFSAVSDMAASADGQFAKYVASRTGEDYVITASSTVRLPVVEPDIVTENGVSRLTDKGRALGIELEDGLGKRSHSLIELRRMKTGFELLRQWQSDESNAATKGWLSQLGSGLGNERRL